MNTNIKKVEEHKMIAVVDLPECYFKERLTLMVKDANRAMVCVAAKEGHANDWVVYIGWPKFEHLKEEFQTEESLYYCTNQHFSQGVLSYGDKVNQETAQQLFPEWIGKKYRG